MKAKAPEKVYLYPSDRAGEEYEDEWGNKPWGEDCVEYTRTDIFVEKACAFLETYPHMFFGVLRSDVIEDFKKYMEDLL